MGKGCEGILPQGKGFHNARKLRKIVAIYKTDKIILSKKSLKKVPKKDKGSEKVPYSKSRCSKVIFFNQTMKYSRFLVSLWAIIVTEERTHTIIVCKLLPNSFNPIYIGCVQIYTPLSFLSCCLLEREPITLCVTDLYFL